MAAWLPWVVLTALVLHYVLTLWHCLVNILPQHGWPLPPKGDTIRVAYLGECRGYLAGWQLGNRDTTSCSSSFDMGSACLPAVMPAR